MDSSGFLACPGEVATPEELHRVALTVALAISNPCVNLQRSVDLWEWAIASHGRLLVPPRLITSYLCRLLLHMSE